MPRADAPAAEGAAALLLPQQRGERWEPRSDPTGTASGAAWPAGSTDVLALPPALRRAMDFGKLPPWKRRLLRPNWGGISNTFFGTACVCFVISSYPPLQEVERLAVLGCSGPKLSQWANLGGSFLFLVEPVFDFMAVWVECWDDILWTAREEQSNPGPRSASSDGSSSDGGEGLQSSRQSSAVWALMLRKLHFWGAMLFGAGSLLYFWWALLPFTAGPEDAACYDCVHKSGAVFMYFECVDEDYAALANGRGECNLPWLGSAIFVLNAVVALVAWRVYRDETTDFLGTHFQHLGLYFPLILCVV